MSHVRKYRIMLFFLVMCIFPLSAFAEDTNKPTTPQEMEELVQEHKRDIPVEVGPEMEICGMEHDQEERIYTQDLCYTDAKAAKHATKSDERLREAVSSSIKDSYGYLFDMGYTVVLKLVTPDGETFSTVEVEAEEAEDEQ